MATESPHLECVSLGESPPHLRLCVFIHTRGVTPSYLLPGVLLPMEGALPRGGVGVSADKHEQCVAHSDFSSAYPVPGSVLSRVCTSPHLYLPA